MAKARKKSYLKAGSSSAWKYIFIIGGIIAVAACLVIGMVKTNTDISGIGNFIKTCRMDLIHWTADLFSDFSINPAQIILSVVVVIAMVCFFKNFILLITSVFYGVVFFITLGGVNIMNSYWFWILIIAAELIAVFATYFSIGASFISCCENILWQLFVLVPVWLILGCLCLYASEKENVQMENLFCLILQFLTFAIVLGYQMIMMFSSSSDDMTIRDIVADIIDDD